MKTEIDRLASVWEVLATDTELSRYVSEWDISYFRKRIEAEGLTFLTVELPRLGKAFDAACAKGYISPIEGFKSSKGQSYPQFLSRAWAHLTQKRWVMIDRYDHWHRELDRKPVVDDVPVLAFDYDRYPTSLRGGQLMRGWDLGTDLNKDGDRIQVLEYEPSIIDRTVHKGTWDSDYAGAAACIRQLTLMFYKLKLPYTQEQVSAVEAAFLRSEAELADLELSAPHVLVLGRKEVDRTDLLTRASRLVHRLLHRFNPMEILPRHGSGASACKTPPWERYRNPRWISKLNDVYPYADWFYSGYAHLCDEYHRMAELAEEPRPMARVVYVPKDSRGPRLISAEPREFMYIQQGLMAKLYDAIESYPAIRGQLSCIDQTRNNRLSYWGSIGGPVATLDLKEASDRVSLELVRAIFPSNWVKSFEACRSEATVLPCGKIVPLRKFAPMGSAICFPVEAICFWSIMLAACLPSTADFDRLFGDVPIEQLEEDSRGNPFVYSVFGDDIVVPTIYAERTMVALESVGLVVNRQKSYLDGPFRESCGTDWYDGTLVSPVRARHLPLSVGNRTSMNNARFRTLDWFNNLIGHYGTHLTDPLQALFESWYGPVLVSDKEVRRELSSTHPSRGLVLLGPITKVPAEVKRRYNPELCRSEVRVLIETGVDREVNHHDWSHVLRVLLVGSSTKGAGVVSLAKRLKYKYGWIPL